MRIVAVEPLIVEVPMHEPVKGVHGITRSQYSVLVRITTDAGIEGWGNVDPSPGYTLMSADEIHAWVAAMAPALIGRDATDLNAALSIMDRAVAGCCEAKAAIEMALCNVKARALGIRCTCCLAGASNPRSSSTPGSGRCRRSRPPGKRLAGLNAASVRRRRS